MNCCSRHVSGAQRCFGWMSKMYERRYRRKGLDKQQLQMVARLESLGIEGTSLLEVGCGVGVLHQTLLQKGAATALGIDLAPRMLELAGERARAHHLDERTEYVLGDVVEIGDALATSDVAVLDKVVCCYPAPRTLLGAVMAKTRRVIALTYPRKHLLGEISNGLWNFGFWLMRSDFRTFVHDPDLIQLSIESKGFRRVFNHDTIMWHTQVFVTD